MRRGHDQQETIDDFKVYDLLGRGVKTLFQWDHLRPSIWHIHLSSWVWVIVIWNGIWELEGLEWIGFVRDRKEIWGNSFSVENRERKREWCWCTHFSLDLSTFTTTSSFFFLVSGWKMLVFVGARWDIIPMHNNKRNKELKRTHGPTEWNWRWGPWWPGLC